MKKNRPNKLNFRLKSSDHFSKWLMKCSTFYEGITKFQGANNLVGHKFYSKKNLLKRNRWNSIPRDSESTNLPPCSPRKTILYLVNSREDFFIKYSPFSDILLKNKSRYLVLPMQHFITPYCLIALNDIKQRLMLENREKKRNISECNTSGFLEKKQVFHFPFSFVEEFFAPLECP